MNWLLFIVYFHYHAALYHRMRMQYCYIMGWYGEALEAGHRAAKILQHIDSWYEEAGT
jgi:hypothetical protein